MNMIIKIDINGALLKGNAPDIVQRNLESAVTKTTMLLYREVAMRTPQGVSGASGLMGSIKSDVLQKGTTAVKGVVATNSKYGEVVEKGRSAGKGIPIDQLTRWVQVKLGISDPEIIRKVSIIISKRAKKYGIKGVHMFENALNANYGKIETIFNKAGFDISNGLNS